MLLDVCLVVYNQSTSRKRVPGYWSILMGRSDLSKGTVFQAVGSGFHGYQPEIKRNYDLKNTFRKYTTFSLGQIDDSHLSHLEQLTMSLPGAGTAPNPLDPFSVSSVSPNEVPYFDSNSRARTAKAGQRLSSRSLLTKASFLLRRLVL